MADILTSQQRSRWNLTETEVAKPTVVAYRPNAKYPWLIRQGHAQVKLTERQRMELVMDLMSTSVGEQDRSNR